MKHFSVLVVFACLAACGPNPPPPVKVMAVVPSATGAYSTQEVQLQTISSITALKGTVAELIGGARIIVDSNDPLQNASGGLAYQNDTQRFASVVKDKGLDVRGNYVERGGVLWPADFDTWNMVTTYYNFERSYAYFQALYGAEVPELLKMQVYYSPEVHIDSPKALVDNAVFLAFIKAWVVVPQENQQLIPFAMNLGVIGHETSHRVFNKRVLADYGIHPALVSWQLTAFNLLKSIDEGFADFHGYGVTCTSVTGCLPSFLGVSVSDAAVVKSRSLANNDACMTAPLRTSFKTSLPGAWVSSPDMYQLGTLFASTLYQVGNTAAGVAGVRQMQRALLAAYDDPTPAKLGLSQLVNQNINNPAAFTPEEVANSIAVHIDDLTLRDRWCGEVVERLQLDCPAFTDCPKLPDCRGTSSTSTKCPKVPQ